jgi:hypothetical protein
VQQKDAEILRLNELLRLQAEGHMKETELLKDQLLFVTEQLKEKALLLRETLCTS